MNQEIADLLELQKLDVRIGALEDFMNELPSRREALEAERRAAEEEVENKRAELGKVRQDLKESEKKLARGEERIKELQGKLNQVKTNKEYDASLKEIEDQKKKNGILEEEILELYDKVETAEEEEKKLEAEWSEKKKEFGVRSRELEELASRTEAELEEKKSERENKQSALSADNYKLYEKLRQNKKRAVVRTLKEVCLGCHRHIPAQLYNEVLKGEKLVFCSNCERILVYTEDDIEAGLTEIGDAQ